MKIPFTKIGSAPRSFHLEQENARLEGTLNRIDTHRVALSGQMSGSLDLICDRCGQPYVQTLDDVLQLRIMDGVAQDKEDLDIIEFFDGTIDLAQLFQSEINALEGDYHFCSACKEAEQILDIEF